MTAPFKLRALTCLATTLLAIAVVFGSASHALAFCSTCGTAPATYSVGYAAPVTYTAAYAPTYTTAYAPAYTTYSSGGWYPGKFLGRVNRAIWGYPTTTYYAPVTYTAAYAPTYTASYGTTAYYAAPACSSCSAGYAAPACSTCTASYAPACSTCTASYAPACSTCTASYAPACSTCATCESSYAVATPACPTCAAGTVEQASYSETVAPPPTATYGSSTTTTEPQPEIDPGLSLPAERSELRTQKPEVTEPATQPAPQPGPAELNDDSATNLQAPQLFDPNDQTAARHRAPVWTAVYHRVGKSDRAVRPVSHSPISIEQVERDAEGWTSASK